MPARTLSDLRTYVKTLVGDPGSTNDFFSDAAYYRFVSDAYLECARYASIAEVETTVNVVASTALYNVTGVKAIMQVDYDDKPLTPITADLLYAMDADWETRTGTPEYVVLNHTAEWGNIETADSELRGFLVYATPDASLASGFRVIGLTAPAAITTAADEPSCLPDWAHDAVAFEGAARVQESYGDQRNEALASAYRSMRDFYLGYVSEYASNEHAKMVWTVRGSRAAPNSRNRETSINATGRAASGQ